MTEDWVPMQFVLPPHGSVVDLARQVGERRVRIAVAVQIHLGTELESWTYWRYRRR